MNELQIIFDHLDKACCPEDVFGTGDQPKTSYTRLLRACHTDTHKDPIAEFAFRKLNELWREAEERIKNGEYGKRLPLPHCTPLEIGKYKVRRKPIVGDIADIYYVEGASRLVKVARIYDDNDLMRAEARALQLLDGISGPVRDGAPILAETFQISGSRKREVNVINDFPGFVTAEQVRNKMVVDNRTTVWMFKRILSLLTWVHHFKLVHGAILPPHVLFYPDNDGHIGMDPRKHSIRLIDWCYSVDFTSRTRLSSWVPAWKDHYPPELIAKSSISPASDIYMAAKLIRYLSEKMPDSLENVITKCLDPDPAKRYQKAEDVMEEWVGAATAVYGKPKWHDFNL